MRNLYEDSCRARTLFAQGVKICATKEATQDTNERDLNNRSFMQNEMLKWILSC